jgi:acylphosphatase
VIRRRVIVTGRVQGVFFRDSTRRAAISRGVAGWVRNNPDGTVEAVFEGDAVAVDVLVDQARAGPSRADVQDVVVHEEEPERLDGFEVR